MSRSTGATVPARPLALATRIAACVGLSLTLTSGTARGQGNVLEISVGFGVDTTVADVGAIVRLVSDYFRLPGAGKAPTELWNDAEQLRRPDYDLTASLVFQGFRATIAGISSTGPGDREYVVKTLFATADSSGEQIRPIALQRLYAIRRPDGGWHLESALPRLTRDWVSTEIKDITYRAPPEWPFDTTRAERAARFVDSLSHALGSNKPAHLDYYVTSSAEDLYRILGLDYFVLPSGPGSGRGGKSYPVDGLVFSGDPAQGEAYFHELAHAVVGAAFPAGVPNMLVSEGFATWAGGSHGRSFAETMRWLLDYQNANPDVQFLQLIGGATPGGWGNDETDALYASGALIFDVVNTHYGLWGLRRLLGLPRPNRAVEPLLRDLLEFYGTMDGWWRTETQRAVTRLRSVP